MLFLQSIVSHWKDLILLYPVVNVPSMAPLLGSVMPSKSALFHNTSTKGSISFLETVCK